MAYALSGTVRLPDNSPVEGATVVVVKQANDEVVGTATTNAAGAWEVGGLDNATYDAYVRVAGKTAPAMTGVVPSEVLAAPTITITTPEEPLEAGQTRQLAVSVTGSPTPVVTYQSDDEAVATVDSTGLITAVAEGSCTITATATNSEGEASDGYALEVEAADEPPGEVVMVRDDFSGAEEEVVHERSPTWDGGSGVGSWSVVEGDGFVITNNRARPWLPGVQSIVSQPLDSPDVEIRLTLRRMSAAGYMVLYWRAAGASSITDGYRIIYLSSSWRLQKRQSGSNSNLTGSPPNVEDEWVVGTDREIVVRHVGTKVDIWIDGVKQFNADDTSNPISDAGRIGLEGEGGLTAGHHVDDIEVVGVSE